MTIRVAVTTTADSFNRWKLPLESAGLEPVPLACIAIRPESKAELAAARVRAADADLLLITSARTVRLLWPEGGMPATPAAVVGDATAQAVEKAGGSVGVRGGGDGDDLVDLMVDGLKGKRIFFPAARDADPFRARRLSAAGARVETQVAYTTVPVAPGPDPVDVAVFGSPTTLAGWLLSRTLDELRLVAAMGAVTAAALRERGREPDVVPKRPSVEAIARELVVERTT